MSAHAVGARQVAAHLFGSPPVRPRPGLSLAFLVAGLLLFAGRSGFAAQLPDLADLPRLYPRPIVILPAAEGARGTNTEQIIGLEAARLSAMTRSTEGMKPGALAAGRLPDLPERVPPVPVVKPPLIRPERRVARIMPEPVASGATRTQTE